jgi:hypothetical protein
MEIARMIQVGFAKRHWRSVFYKCFCFPPASYRSTSSSAIRDWYSGPFPVAVQRTQSRPARIIRNNGAHYIRGNAVISSYEILVYCVQNILECASTSGSATDRSVIIFNTRWEPNRHTRVLIQHMELLFRKVGRILSDVTGTE